MDPNKKSSHYQPSTFKHNSHLTSKDIIYLHFKFHKNKNYLLFQFNTVRMTFQDENELLFTKLKKNSSLVP